MIRLLVLASFSSLCICFMPLNALGQLGHPAKGSWSGYWEYSSTERRRALVVLDWVDNEITGVINPGRSAAQITHAELDVSSWTLTIEAEMEIADGPSGHFVATGKLENLGSWTGRRYSGTYRHGQESGIFVLTLN